MPRYTKPEFAEREGITVNILNHWIYRYGLPVIQIGVRTYIDDEDFKIWMAGNKKILTPVAEPVRPIEVAMSQPCRKQAGGFLSKLRPAK